MITTETWITTTKGKTCSIAVELTGDYNGYHYIGALGKSKPVTVAFETGKDGRTKYWEVEGKLSPGQKKAMEKFMRQHGLVLEGDVLPK